MAPEEINKIIAEKVMGWTWLGGDYFDAYKEHSGYGGEFDPYHRIDHAMMALEKFEAWSLQRDVNQYYCEVWRCREVHGISNVRIARYDSEWADTPSAAISLALVEAVKEGI